MEFTGERFVPQCQGEIAAEHYHRYFFASGFVAGKRVLDIASGEGYGTHILAQSAAHVTGVDISPEAVANATQKYAGDRIAFLQGSAATIPLPDAAVDVVVSFETLEHLSEQEDMLSEMETGFAAGRPAGHLHAQQAAIQQAGRQLSRQRTLPGRIRCPAQKPLRPCFPVGAEGHVRFAAESGTGGETYCSANGEEDGAWSGVFTEQARYFIALAGNGPLPPTQSSFFDYPLEKSDLTAQLRENLAELQERHDAAQARLEAVEAAYTAILASRSWRATAPLRRLRHLLKGKGNKS